MTVQQYILSIQQRYRLGNSTEHTFRGDLQQLIESLVPHIRATNEPKRQKCGAPDYILTKDDIPVGFIEAKDIGDKDLEGKKKTGNKEQFERYKASLTNLIFTDYLQFHLYQEGEPITKISIAEIRDGEIVPLPQNFKAFENLIKDFVVHISQNIKNSKRLAELMAGKARLLADVISKALTSDETHNEDSTLKDQMLAFKDILIHDITPKGFADVYAQTIAYGMFAARLHDPTLETFSRQEAAELIPKSNPFLRKLFGYIAGPDIDERIKWIVDNLTEIFLACNVEEILKNYGKATKMEDPIIHFYETFLAEYDPKLRKARGVWYTPAPVVKFIVRAVDDILKTDFGLKQGLADTSKTKIKVRTQNRDKRTASGYKEEDQEVHKVQILDPATGTGTFLAEVIKHVYSKFKGQEGIWNGYVEKDLLPRLNGFELLMASYAMAHLKIDLLLNETGYRSSKYQRTKIYLTNSLEESHPDTGTLFSSWLSNEANEANHIKRDTPVMCVIGNPPYAVNSTNNGNWIKEKIEDYKIGVKGANKNSLSDDYVKFIRYGQHYIDKNGSGVLAYISNNSFLDGITHHKMRESLLKSFNKAYVIDLHGSTKKKESTPDGGKDENVFDIQQGVSINIFIKIEEAHRGYADVYQFDLYGLRKNKYDFLEKHSLNTINWTKLNVQYPELFFKQFDYDSYRTYQNWISIDNIFNQSGTGIKFRKDSLLVKPHFTSDSVIELLNDMQNLENSEIHNKYSFKDTADWKLNNKRQLFNLDFDSIKEVDYRLFDKRFTYYPEDRINNIIVRGDSRSGLMKNLNRPKSLALLTAKQQSSSDFQHSFVSRSFVDMCALSSESKESTVVIPLYLYNEDNQQTTDYKKKQVNINQDIIIRLQEDLNLLFVDDDLDIISDGLDGVFSPEDVFDYIYAILHSPTYRTKYKEFLKIDFPRIPFPKHQKTFWQLVKFGNELRGIHLLESSKIENYITTYPENGSNKITRKLTKTDVGYEAISVDLGRVWINDEQYFNNVPLKAWEFYIGGYQPAQKWLKDRKGMVLGYDDILHYQKIIVALTETDRIMSEIDKIDFNI